MSGIRGACATCAALAGLFAAPGASAEIVGRVLMAAGEARAIRGGQPVELRFGSTIEDKDTLQTGLRSNLQVRFNDESVMSLREQTQLRIDDYKYAGRTDGSEKAFFRLLKGAFRTVTGLIGRVDHSKYAVATPVATIGIRGTMYGASLCENDCFDADGKQAPNGLYAMVMGQSHQTNKITLQNKLPDPQVVGLGEVVHLDSDTGLARRLLEPPGHLIDRLAGAGNAKRPSAAVLGPGGAGDGIGGREGRLERVSSSGGGIGGDSRPNIAGVPPPIDQINQLTVLPAVYPVTQNVGPGGAPPSNILAPISSGVAFISVGGTGDVRGQLVWTTSADMDLHMFLPQSVGGTEVYFGRTLVQPQGTSLRAQLDVDNTRGGTVSAPAVENIQVDGAVPGDYRFFVRNFSGTATAPVLRVTGDNNRTGRQYNLPSISGGQSSQTVTVTRSPSGTASYSP